MVRAAVLILAFIAPAIATSADANDTRQQGQQGPREVSLHASRSGDAVDISASATLSVAQEVAWRVLTAYDRYASFIPDMESSRVVSREGDQIVVEQRGSARWLWLTQPVTIRLAVTETPPVLVRSRLIGGTIRDMRGRYELVRDAERLRLVYTGRIVPDDSNVGYFDLLAVRANASRQFTALVDEIERAGQVEARSR